MKLIIFCLEYFSVQDQIDLGKIWLEYFVFLLSVDEMYWIYVVWFNECLLGVVRVMLSGMQGVLDFLCVCEIICCCGVG